MTVTLKNLAIASAQEVFDQVSKHLLKQKVKALRFPDSPSSVCAYRAPGGLRCAAGCLITLEEYDPRFEGSSWSTLLAAGRVPKEHSVLIIALQHIHDQQAPLAWEQSLKNLAVQFQLNFKHHGKRNSSNPARGVVAGRVRHGGRSPSTAKPKGVQRPSNCQPNGSHRLHVSRP